MFRIFYRKMSTIHLNDKEKELFSVVRGCLAWKGRQTVARVAGGWLRDKVGDSSYISTIYMNYVYILSYICI